MNTDIRLSVGFWQHPKTKKLVRRLGLEGVRSLQILWLWVAQNKPDGNLSDMDWEDIELAADWNGTKRSFFKHCLGSWIDKTEDGFCLHDWQEHNPWQSEAGNRADIARKAAMARWSKQQTPKEQNQNNDPVLNGQDAPNANANATQCPSNANANATQCPSNANANATQCPSNANANAQAMPLSSPLQSKNKGNLKHTRNHDLELNLDARAREAQIVPESVCSGEENQNSVTPSCDDAPIEFQELREYYNANARAENSYAGLNEYLAIHRTSQWPGINAVYHAIDDFAANDGQWKAGFPPGLARFIRERYWKAKPNVDARASPQSGERESDADRAARLTWEAGQRILAKQARLGEGA